MIGDQAAAERTRFVGSPTVRVDGRDVDPDGELAGEYTLECRLYWHQHHLAGYPQEHAVRSIDVHLVTHEEVNRGRARVAPTRGLTLSPTHRRVRAGRPRPAAAHRRAHRPARRPRRCPATSCSSWPGRRRRARRRALPGPARRRRRLPAAQLVLHPADPPFTIAERREHPRPGRVPRSSPSRSARWSTSPPGAPARPPGPAPTRRPCPRVAGSVLRGSRPLPALLDRLRETFGLDAVTLLERRPDAPVSPDRATRPGRLAGRRRRRRPALPDPGRGRRRRPVDDDDLAWCCAATRWPPPTGASWRPSPPRPPSRCASNASRSAAAAAGPLAEADRMRTALLVRGQPRPAHPARLRQGRRRQPAQHRRRVHRRRPRRSCSPPPRSRSTGSAAWSRTCST